MSPGSTLTCSLGSCAVFSIVTSSQSTEPQARSEAVFSPIESCTSFQIAIPVPPSSQGAGSDGRSATSISAQMR